MSQKTSSAGLNITRQQMIPLLNKDLAVIIVQEQEHEIDLAAALGINVPLS